MFLFLLLYLVFGLLHFALPCLLKAGSDQTETIAEEIAVSGRQKDVENLVNRIARNDYRLTILHGQLGVGKSSLIQAGLIPTLEASPIDTRDVAVVLVRRYLKWIDRIGEKLVKKTQRHINPLGLTLNSEEFLLQQLHFNGEHNLLTVLMFDQFEEFFVTFPKALERRSFFDFLSQCLDIPFVKIIFSLREDYLHYLLEWERYNDLNAIGGNILGKKHRYELSNFSIEDTQRIIQGLTNQFRLSLEPQLVERLVTDLAGELGEIRPIELQVAGAQLHEEKINTLAKYRALGNHPKEILVQNYLQSVVRDCGPENEQAANLVLFLLTGENNTRPSKTREELETDLKALEDGLLKEVKRLDLVLEIFRRSGLVFLLPENPSDRYQLVHDYLVRFIRRKQPLIDSMIRELESQKEQINRTKEKLRLEQLEREIEKENRRREREHEERRLAQLRQESEHRRKRQARLLASSFISILILSISLKVLDDNRKAYKKSSQDELIARVMVHEEGAKHLLRTLEQGHLTEEEALAEALKAAYLLHLPKDIYRPLEGQALRTRLRSTALILQNTIREIQNKYDLDNPLEDRSITANPVEYDDNQLNSLVISLHNFGCDLLLIDIPQKNNEVKQLIRGQRLDVFCE
jgi:hypothetical protein